MPALLERAAAQIAYWHARRVYARFLNASRDIDTVQTQVLRRVLSSVADSDYGRRCALGSVHTPNDLKHAAPLVTYEDLRPYVERVWQGDTRALFGSRDRVQMFATSSGTTAQRKLVPVTLEFLRQYRRGWNTFGLKMLSDHPQAMLRAILQSSGRYDESYSPSGVPCGAITGLMARTQKRIVRRFYVGRPELALLDDPQAKYYALMRFGVVRDVGFAVTANPATLIRMAQVASERSTELIRDVYDGTLSTELLPDAPLRRRLEGSLRPAPDRARELERLRAANGCLRPRDYWQLEFLACWTGGSMGHYLMMLTDWWGPTPIRDIGLLASEGRVTIPLEDGSPAGALDTQGAFFEFIPVAQWNVPEVQTLTARQLELGKDYTVVLTNSAGLIRYRLDDVVRLRGWVEQAPLLEFLHRAGGVASIAGEKLTENQVTEAVRLATTRLRVHFADFIVAPSWGVPPFYQITSPHPPDVALADAIEEALNEQNHEYRSRRKSLRLGPLKMRQVHPDTIAGMDRRLIATRKSSAEQYKRCILLTRIGEDDELLRLRR